MRIDSMDPIDIPEDKLGEYEHYVSVSIRNITDSLDETFEESGAPINSKDLTLK